MYIMNFSLSIVIFICLILILYIKPSAIINFANTMVGKLVLTILTILVAMQNTICGLLMAFLLIILLEYTYEGFEELNKKQDKKKKMTKSKSRAKKVEDNDRGVDKKK